LWKNGSGTMLPENIMTDTVTICVRPCPESVHSSETVRIVVIAQLRIRAPAIAPTKAVAAGHESGPSMRRKRMAMVSRGAATHGVGLWCGGGVRDSVTRRCWGCRTASRTSDYCSERATPIGPRGSEPPSSSPLGPMMIICARARPLAREAGS
jgi:hypothetical protein